MLELLDHQIGNLLLWALKESVDLTLALVLDGIVAALHSRRVDGQMAP